LNRTLNGLIYVLLLVCFLLELFVGTDTLLAVVYMSMAFIMLIILMVSMYRISNILKLLHRRGVKPFTAVIIS